ncbi:CoA-binding protein [[Phormidium ambiguum] IAM M-71]|uniref:CoA-binding protein n=1 Tax=[Phormidium ambiguum] IAM M-71 TaxID=454136 RepID=A0A1U7I534_9CYAN|nr:CoA-binding protein [Phormidium ambiguum]OKH31356.1 CoA-binding protein [Phormidium ambiguum IAM M-71]
MFNSKLNNNTLHDILIQTKIIAVVGHSDNPTRISYQIAQFLRQVGYIVIPVNPMVSEIDGQPCYASLQDVPQSVDLVNVFRRCEYLPEIVSDAIAIDAKTIWAQSGIYDEHSAKKALQAGLNVVMDSCIKVEYNRLNISR